MIGRNARWAGFLAAGAVVFWLVTASAPSAKGLQKAEPPLCAVAHVDVLPPSMIAGTDLLRHYQAESRKDAGALRVDVFVQLGRPNHSTIVSVWESRKAFEAHLAAEHTKAFRAKLQPMLGSPYDERLHQPLE